MKTLHYSAEILPQPAGLEGVYKQINLAKICYRSDKQRYIYHVGLRKDPIEDDGRIHIFRGVDGVEYSGTLDELYCNRMIVLTREPDYLSFVKRMISSKHLSTLEHGTIYLKIPVWNEGDSHLTDIVNFYRENPYSRVHCQPGDFKDGGVTIIYYITTNYRVVIENGRESDLEFLVGTPEELHEKRVTVKFSTQVAITRELNRHRSNSVSESSTRYCNYGSDRFGNEISVSLPTWISAEDLPETDLSEYCKIIASGETGALGELDYWMFANLAAEFSYISLVRAGWTAEKARVVLPLDTESGVIYTAYLSDWEKFIQQRAYGSTGKPHPDAEALVKELYQKLKSSGYNIRV